MTESSTFNPEDYGRGRRPDGSFKRYLGEHVDYSSENSEAFAEAIKRVRPRRILRDPYGWGFVTPEGEAHAYVNNDLFWKNEANARIRDRLNRAAELSGAQVLDGTIRTHNHTGQIYQIYTSSEIHPDLAYDNPTMAAALEANYRNWSEVVREVIEKGSEAYFQFYDQSTYLKRQHTVIDLTSGNQHYVTDLVNSRQGSSLERVRKDFPEIRMQDNTQIYDWGRVLLKGETV